jgi:chemotaxis-related protein WspD
MSQEDSLATAALTAAPPDTELELSACWGNSGVYGDGSCPELQKFVHCRNCPIYSAAAVRLLDRPLPQNYRQEWTQHFAELKKPPEAGNASVILFRIQTEWLALPTHSFQEIAEKRPLHSLPNRQGGIVLGLANVRGELVTCVSLGHLLSIQGMPPLPSVRADYRHLLIVQWEAAKLAFPVDEVHGPNRFHPQEFKSPPSTLARANPRCAQAVLSWQNRVVGLLDPELLFSNLSRCLA